MIKPVTISKANFVRLKAGDVLLFKSGPRTVQEGPGDYVGDKSRASIMIRLSKIRNTLRKYPSFRSPSTLYHYWDICRKCRMPPRCRIDKSSVCAAERDALRSLGFDPVESIEREISRAEWLDGMFKRTSRYPRAMRVARAKLRRLKRKVKR